MKCAGLIRSFTLRNMLSVRVPKTPLILFLFFLFICSPAPGQLNVNDWTLALFSGTINYQGDLKPTSFTFNHSNPAFSLVLRKPLNRWFNWRIGASIGKIEGADRYNRDYLKTRNLSFFTELQEIYTGLEINLLDISTKHFTPYMYGGIGLFHFNPWTYDNNGEKVYLKPLSTEGQGLPEYPKQKLYNLVQSVLGFGVGAKYALSSCANIGIEFSQRKTFTDYLDDVSSAYIDQGVLRAAKGDKAVELAWRGDEVPGGTPYPHDGEQRGTKTEMDWYYFFGLSFEVKLSCLKNIIGGWQSSHSKLNYSTKCPRFY